MEHAKEIAFGLLIFVFAVFVCGGIGLALYNTGQHNREKVEHMNQLCIESGHTGWKESIGCFGGTNN